MISKLPKLTNYFSSPTVRESAAPIPTDSAAPIPTDSDKESQLPPSPVAQEDATPSTSTDTADPTVLRRDCEELQQLQTGDLQETHQTVTPISNDPANWLQFTKDYRSISITGISKIEAGERNSESIDCSDSETEDAILSDHDYEGIKDEPSDSDKNDDDMEVSLEDESLITANDMSTIKLNKLVSTVLNRSLVKNELFNFFKPINVRNVCVTNQLCGNVPFTLTDIGEGIREVAVKEWYVKVGDKVSQFDNICEVQSDKASVTITSRYDGVITKLYYEIDQIAHVGKPLVDIETDAFENAEIKSEINESLSNDADLVPSGTLNDSAKLAIPSVRRLAKENKINLDHVHGSGKGGRILKEDILKYLEHGKNDNMIKSEASHPSGVDIEPIKGFTRTMIKTMTESLKIPHLGYCDELVITELTRIRKLYNEQHKETGIKLTTLPFFIKAISNGLRQYPILNSSLDDAAENIIHKSSHNIGVAMDTNSGLAVPVIKNVEKLSILEIAKELNRLLKHRIDGRFAASDLSGGTFTISNIGIIGGTYVSPIIVPRQAAIIGIGKANMLPRFDSKGNVVAEEIVNLSASADHRIIDGATIAHFINTLKHQLENPTNLLLQS
ncbi:hypothetical protein RN001_008823 [Aquatica leii]|uniref:Dihydrolipoamide acetyltransferase component of pyruvate dehydrogenase complex n=1 Tax=Aquatica leii TaxID=1421715 RepID=A0AAN7PA39_9COLE|nr:hypothetical protein RN001_008823 [Aquatica leii]